MDVWLTGTCFGCLRCWRSLGGWLCCLLLTDTDTLLLLSVYLYITTTEICRKMYWQCKSGTINMYTELFSLQTYPSDSSMKYQSSHKAKNKIIHAQEHFHTGPDTKEKWPVSSLQKTRQFHQESKSITETLHEMLDKVYSLVKPSIVPKFPMFTGWSIK